MLVPPNLASLLSLASTIANLFEILPIDSSCYQHLASFFVSIYAKTTTKHTKLKMCNNKIQQLQKTNNKSQTGNTSTIKAVRIVLGNANTGVLLILESGNLPDSALLIPSLYPLYQHYHLVIA